MATETRLYIYSEVYDEGEWLRPFLETAAAENQLVPDEKAVERMRERLFRLIELESVPLVA